MTAPAWDVERVRAWVSSQDWYQTIPVIDGVVTPGSVDSRERLSRMNLPSSLAGLSVLDVGCNSGMYCFEAARRGAVRVVGIDVNEQRLEQARTLAEITGEQVQFERMRLLEAASLGRFDLVLCFAVLTEVSDLVASLETLGEVTTDTMYLEMAVLDGSRARVRLPPRLAALASRLVYRQPIAQLRRTKRGWSWVPERRLLDAVLGPDFDIVDLGESVRYRLFRMQRKAPAARRDD
jgi:tRNA (mo5U34)-methyltransferase